MLNDDKPTTEVKEKIRQTFLNKKDSIFYVRQLQIMFEKDYFHWVTTRAIIELEKEGFLRSILLPIEKDSNAKFIFYMRHRYFKRQINKTLPLIKQYSDSIKTRALGKQAEILFLNALAKEGFMPYGDSNIKEYKGKFWSVTDHNLDFIIEKDGIGYGCEIKNTLDYIDKEELDAKLQICAYLGLKPLFIMRYAPKTYIYEIFKQGGYTRLFVKQIYPLGHEPFVERLVKELGLPTECRAEITKGFLNGFVKFHEKYVNSKKNSQGRKCN